MRKAGRVAVVTLVCLFAVTSRADDDVRGLVAEQPASGRYVETDKGFMVPYTETIPGTDVTIEMVPVPGGTFTFGSTADEEERGEYALPPVEVTLPPFWIGKHEILWAAYWQYMELNDDFAKLQAVETLLAADDSQQATEVQSIVQKLPNLAAAVDTEVTFVDGVTAPTPLYDESTTYECGQDPNRPAATMTQYAAKQFTKWLSQITGVDYRLPIEAEWEYAARAGSTTAYPFGDDPEQLGDYAWYDENSDYCTKPVGQKKPNAWGLHDMLGNVAEMVIDEYHEEVERPEGEPLSWEQAIRWPTSDGSRIVRGGYYDLPAEDCRTTSRFPTDDSLWKASDPNSPLSPWWYADYPSTGVGFRIVRPLEPMAPELAARFWEFGSEGIEADVNSRINVGRGKLGPLGPTLPQVREELDSESLKPLLQSDD